MNVEEISFAERDCFVEDRVEADLLYGWHVTTCAYGLINKKLVEEM